MRTRTEMAKILGTEPTEFYKNTDYVNRSHWKKGPWDNEPDKVVWIDPETGLDCMVTRQSTGYLCGYVAVKKGHLCYGVDYNELLDFSWDDERPPIEFEDNSHGGLTYSAECQGHVCHLSDDGDHVWWFGFDCNHSSDKAPASTSELHRALMFGHCSNDWGTYRDMRYVVASVIGLAKSLSKAKIFVSND